MKANDKRYKKKILIEVINQLWYHSLINSAIYKECISEVNVIVEDFELPENLKMKKLICYLFGHNMYKLTETDNGRSKFGYHKCSRCGYEEHYQDDYN